jgi:hypothetical protein
VAVSYDVVDPITFLIESTHEVSSTTLVADSVTFGALLQAINALAMIERIKIFFIFYKKYCKIRDNL